jgi:hypothetical protein
MFIASNLLVWLQRYKFSKRKSNFFPVGVLFYTNFDINKFNADNRIGRGLAFSYEHNTYDYGTRVASNNLLTCNLIAPLVPSSKLLILSSSLRTQVKKLKLCNVISYILVHVQGLNSHGKSIFF